MLENGGYRLGRKMAVVGRNCRPLMLKIPTSTYEKLVYLAESHKNSMNRQIMTLIEEGYECHKRG